MSKYLKMWDNIKSILGKDEMSVDDVILFNNTINKLRSDYLERDFKRILGEYINGEYDIHFTKEKPEPGYIALDNRFQEKIRNILKGES